MKPTKFHIMRSNRRLINSWLMKTEAQTAGWDEPGTPEYAALQDEVDRMRLERLYLAVKQERRRGWLSRLFAFTLGFGEKA